MQEKPNIENGANPDNPHILRQQAGHDHPINNYDTRHAGDALFQANASSNSFGHFVGNYCLLRLLGYGSFGSVYLAEHRYLKRLAAIKILRTTLNDRDKESFLEEARLLASLSHPNIVRVLEFAVTQMIEGQGDSQFTEYIPYLVMDFAPGDSLRVLYPVGSCLFPNTAINYIKQIAAALQYAHDKGIIHRDVKPENCLLNERQEAMLSDFGLALFAPTPDLLSTQHLEGTLPYTAPEQLRGKPAFASDQYSLAIIAYEWLCGQRPFGGEDLSIILQHIYSPPPDLRSKNPAISSAIEDVIMKALDKDPQRRYPNIQAFAHALEHATQWNAPDFSPYAHTAVRIFSPDQDQQTGVTQPFFPDTEQIGGIKQEIAHTRMQPIDTHAPEKKHSARLKEIQRPLFPRRRSTKLYLLIACIIALILIVGNSAFTALRSLKTTSAGSNFWHLIWGDEFNGAVGTGVYQANWFYDTGTSYPNGVPNWGTGEVETMSKSTANVFQDRAGHLVIRPIRKNGRWTSGRIETQRSDFMAPIGGKIAIQASIRLPNITGAAALGYWPALSMLGAAYRGNYHNWPSVGEINIMENINGFNNTVGTFHCDTTPDGACKEPVGLTGQSACLSTTCQAGFHTYRIEYDRSSSLEQIRWYLDGVQFWQVSSDHTGMDAATWASALHHGFFIILDVAMGGNFPASAGGGPTPTTTSGASLLIDYIRVYTMNGSVSSNYRQEEHNGKQTG